MNSQIANALLLLAGNDMDHAAEKNKIGFNGLDSMWGHELANKLPHLTPGQELSALKMLRKYEKTQLARAGIKLPDEAEITSKIAVQIATAPRPTGTTPKAAKRIVLDGDSIRIFFGYDPALVAAVKTLKSANGFQACKFTDDSNGKHWRTGKANADSVVDFGRKHGFEMDPALDSAGIVAAELAKAETDRRRMIEGMLLKQIDFNVEYMPGRMMFEHQKTGIKQMLSMTDYGTYGALNADDMGLGKTMQALVAAKAWRKAFGVTVVVIAPASLQINWKREAEAVGVELEVYSWAKFPESFSTEYVLIADEAHYSKNAKSQRGSKFMALAEDENCVAVYPLTGTPMKNGRPAEIWPLLRVLRHPVAMDKKAYEIRYCNAGPTNFSRWDTTGAAHLDELYQKISNVMIRRKKVDCLDLPPKIRTVRHAELSAEARKTYDDTLAQAQADYNTGKAQRAKERTELLATLTDPDEQQAVINKMNNADNADAIVLLGHIRRAGSVAKVDTAIELAEEVLNRGDSVVLFTDFIDSAEAIAAQLKDYGCELLTGSVTGNTTEDDERTTKRQAMVDRFQARKSKVFVSTIAAGGVGITLTAASDVIMVDRSWSPGDCFQAEDRCYRIGQKSTVNVVWLQANGADEKMDALIETKQQRIDLVMEGERKTMRGTGPTQAEFARDILQSIKRK